MVGDPGVTPPGKQKCCHPGDWDLKPVCLKIFAFLCSPLEASMSFQQIELYQTDLRLRMGMGLQWYTVHNPLIVGTKVNYRPQGQ